MECMQIPCAMLPWSPTWNKSNLQIDDIREGFHALFHYKLKVHVYATLKTYRGMDKKAP